MLRGTTTPTDTEKLTRSIGRMLTRANAVVSCVRLWVSSDAEMRVFGSESFLAAAELRFASFVFALRSVSLALALAGVFRFGSLLSVDFWAAGERLSLCSAFFVGSAEFGLLPAVLL